MSSVRSMAPVFAAFDHPTYQKLIFNHISELFKLTPVNSNEGGFVVNMIMAVSIDKSHEMLINKHCKMSITKATLDYISRIVKKCYLSNDSSTAHEEQVFKSKKKKN